MRVHLARIGLLALTLVGATLARAEDQPPDPLTSLPLEDLLNVDVERIFSASRFVQDVRRAPASVTVITAADIRRLGFRTLAEALRSALGFYTTYDRNYTYLGVRGFLRPGDYNGRVLLLVDGHRANDNVYDQGLMGTEFLVDIGLVERIEIVRGPSSSLYGSNAFFGVVNVITRQGRNIRGTELELEGGTLATRRARVTVGSRTGAGVEFTVSGSAYHSDGQERLYFPEFDTPEDGHGIVNHLDADAFQSLFGRVSRGNFSVEAGWVSREKHVPTAAFDTVFADPRFITTDRRLFATTQYGRRLDDRTEVVGRLFFDDMHYDGDYPYASPSGRGTTLQADVGNGTGVGGEVLFSRRFLGRDTATFGIELRDNFRLDQWTAYDDAPGFATESREQSRKWAAFAQHDMALTADVVVSAGMRYDHDSGSGGSLNPRLGLILAPDRPATVKVLYGTAFRAPTPYEQFYWPGQERLDPETIRTFETIWDQRLGAHVHASVAAFYTRVDDLISEHEADTVAGIEFVNTDRVAARGVEWVLEGRWPQGWTARFGHTLEDAHDRSTGEPLSNAPRHLSKLGFIAPLGSERVTAGLEGEYVGRRQTLDGSTVDGFYRQNLTIAAERLRGRFDVRMAIGNLFNRHYADPGAVEHRQAVIVQDGRTARLIFGCRF